MSNSNKFTRVSLPGEFKAIKSEVKIHAIRDGISMAKWILLAIKEKLERS